jgi:short-subunit dehydrogenase
MRKTGGGLIVNISSGTSRIVVPALGGGYPAQKRCLEVLSDYLRAQLEGDHIRVLVMLPYITETNLARNALGSRGDQVKYVPVKRSDLPPPDSAEKVADRIVQAIRAEETEVNMFPQRH